MRTTIDLPDAVLKELREILRREGGTVSALLSRLLAAALAQARQVPAATPFQWNARPMGARLDLENKDALRAMLDR